MLKKKMKAKNQQSKCAPKTSAKRKHKEFIGIFSGGSITFSFVPHGYQADCEIELRKDKKSKPEKYTASFCYDFGSDEETETMYNKLYRIAKTRNGQLKNLG